MSNDLNLVDRIVARIGRRGLVLLLLSIVFFLLGLKGYFNPLPNNGDFLLFTYLPSWVRGSLWCGAAVIGAFAALVQRGKNDAIGFAALCIPPTIIGTSYAISSVAHLIGLTAFDVGWVDALQYYVIVLFLMVTSGWAEVDRTVKTVMLVTKKED